VVVLDARSGVMRLNAFSIAFRSWRGSHFGSALLAGAAGQQPAATVTTATSPG